MIVNIATVDNFFGRGSADSSTKSGNAILNIQEWFSSLGYGEQQEQPFDLNILEKKNTLSTTENILIDFPKYKTNASVIPPQKGSDEFVSWLLDFKIEEKDSVWVWEKSVSAWIDSIKVDPVAELRNEILKFKGLSQGWDGEDAEIIAPNAVDNALEFIRGYSGNLKFDAFPDPDGSVELQADTFDGHALISFMADGTAAYFIRKGEEIHRGDRVPCASLHGLLSAFN